MRWGSRCTARLRRWLAGARFSAAVARYERAANELDKAVREVLAR